MTNGAFPKCASCGNEVCGLAVVDYGGELAHADCVATDMHVRERPGFVGRRIDTEAVRILFGAREGAYVDIAVCDNGAIELRGSDSLAVIPQVSNCVRIVLCYLEGKPPPEDGG